MLWCQAKLSQFVEHETVDGSLIPEFVGSDRWFSDFLGSSKAQCVSYFAPSAIHRLSTCFCVSVKVSFEDSGGMTSSASVDSIRRTNSLLSTEPGHDRNLARLA